MRILNTEKPSIRKVSKYPCVTRADERWAHCLLLSADTGSNHYCAGPRCTLCARARTTLSLAGNSLTDDHVHTLSLSSLR